MSKQDGSERVYSVGVSGGEITTVGIPVAIEDCTKDQTFNEETIRTMLDKGEIVFSEEFFYCRDGEPLQRYATKSSTEAISESVAEESGPEDQADALVDGLTEAEIDLPERSRRPIEGDTVVHVKKGWVGDVTASGGKLVVTYVAKGNKSKTVDLSSDWQISGELRLAPPVEIPKPEIALETVTPVIEAEIVEALTPKEQERLNKLEAGYDKLDSAERHIPFEKGKILNRIREGHLYRGTHKTFGEYALARFGITREYAQNLAQIAGIPDLALEAITGGEAVNISVGAANEFLRNTNKALHRLGVGKIAFDAIVPVLRNTLAVMVNVAPRNTEGEVEITPRFVAEFNDALARHLTDGVIEIGGEQMTIQAASEQNLLGPGLRAEVIESTAESIRVNSATIIGEYQDARRRQEVPIKNGGGSPIEVDPSKFYQGDIPKLDVVCSKHGDTEVMELGAGKMLTRCGCRWHVDNGSGSLVAYEVDDKPVFR